MVYKENEEMNLKPKNSGIKPDGKIIGWHFTKVYDGQIKKIIKIEFMHLG